MQQRARQTSPTFRSTLSLTDNACECGPSPRRARGAGQSPPRSSMVFNNAGPTSPRPTAASPPLTKSQSYCPVADGAGVPQGGRSYFLHGSRAHVPSPKPNKLTGYATFDEEASKNTGRKHFKSLVADNNSQHFASGSLIGQALEYTSKRDEYNNKREKYVATSPREVLQEKQNAPQLQSKGVAKAMADAPPSPRKISRRAASPCAQAHLQSPGVAKSLVGKTESPLRQRPIRKGSPSKKECQSPQSAFKQIDRSPIAQSPRRSMKCQSPRARSPSPPWGTDSDIAFSGCKPGASPIRSHIVSNEEAKNLQLRGKAGSQPGTFGSPSSTRPPRTAGKVPALRNDPTVPRQFYNPGYAPAKPNPAVIHERQCYYGGA